MRRREKKSARKEERKNVRTDGRADVAVAFLRVPGSRGPDDDAAAARDRVDGRAYATYNMHERRRRIETGCGELNYGGMETIKKTRNIYHFRRPIRTTVRVPAANGGVRGRPPTR